MCIIDEQLTFLNNFIKLQKSKSWNYCRYIPVALYMSYYNKLSIFLAIILFCTNKHLNKSIF